MCRKERRVSTALVGAHLVCARRVRPTDGWVAVKEEEPRGENANPGGTVYRCGRIESGCLVGILLLLQLSNVVVSQSQTRQSTSPKGMAP